MEDVEKKVREVWPSPYTPLGASWDAEAMEHGRIMAEETADWIDKNPVAFYELFGIVQQIRRDQKKGYLRDRVKIEATDRGLGFGDKMFRRKNGLWAGLVRYMALVDSTLIGDPIRFNKSCIDGYGLPAVAIVVREAEVAR